MSPAVNPQFAVGTSTKAERDKALVAPSRRWSFRYEIINRDGDLKGYPLVADASVQNNDLADDVKRTANFTLLPGGPNIDFMDDRIRAYALLELPGDRWHEWCVGTFLMTTSAGRRASTTRPTAVVGYDPLLKLQEHRYWYRPHWDGGTKWRDAITEILSFAGFNTKGIAQDGKVMRGNGETWPLGTSRLEAINDMLDAIGFDSLTMNPMGQPEAQEHQSPRQAPVVWHYEVGPESVILPGIEDTVDLHSIPNRWVAWVSEPDKPLLLVTRVNDNPNSPTSTVSRGRTITEVLNQPRKLPRKRKHETRRHHRHATQAVLEAYVERAVEAADDTFETLEWQTGLMPFHGSGDVITADWGEGRRRWRHVEWEMELRAGGVMRHKARRVVEA